MKKVMKHINMFICAIFYYIWTALHKKDYSLWLFGAWKGKTYNDNPKYLFEYVSANNPEIKAVWVTKNQAIYDSIKNKGLKVVMYPSKEANKLINRAGVMFQSEGSRDIGYYPVGRTRVVQLYHSIPAKSLGWFEKYKGIKQHIINIECDNNKKSYWLCPSLYYKKLIQNVFDVPDDHFLKVGFPRNDMIAVDAHNKYILELRKNYEKIVLYLPTHRNWGKDFDLKFVENGLLRMDKFAFNKKICFLYKPHPNEIELIKNAVVDLQNVKVLEGSDFEDLYDYLYECDLLISDYSGVIYDFLPSNKPIVLFDYDLENYQANDGGVPEDYFSHQVGPICNTWEDMLKQVSALLENDEWKNKRMSETDYFNARCNGNNSRLLVKIVKDMFVDN